MKNKAIITVIGVVILVLLLAFFFIFKSRLQMLLSDQSWIQEMGYEEDEVHKITFNFSGKHSCPDIPITIDNKSYPLGFDTGCGVGIFFTDVMEDQIEYNLISQIESLNRDGSHRGWSKQIQLDEFSVFEESFKDIVTSMSDWMMFSSQKFNGTIGLKYFQSKVITLDYPGHRIAVSRYPLNYEELNPDEYVVLPLVHSSEPGQEDLPFFEGEYNNQKVMIYLDTGKNYSYVLNPNVNSSMSDRPSEFTDITVKVGDLELKMEDVAQVNDLAQAEGLPYPTMIELNSDQIWNCNLLVTLDLIDQKIIFKERD